MFYVDDREATAYEIAEYAQELRGEILRLQAELAAQKRLNVQLAERLAACSQVLGRAAERGKVCAECQRERRE